MNPLELADRLREDYRRFTWTTYPVADRGLRERLEHMVDEESLLWHGPYLSVQPRFALDESLAGLAGRIGLPGEVVTAFPQVDRLFKHQVQAIERIASGRHTLVATGTGSGKTEAFLIPLVAHAHQGRNRPGVKAIALYPMNALVNDQEDRVRTACEALGLRYGVYTGATPQHRRVEMQVNPPDILLTNYSMLEFILTRREDRKLFGSGVLRHLVLDEIHTYQGALGTELACLVRRLRGHVDADDELVCVGLSATVSAGGDHEADLRRTSTFASALFGAEFDVDAVVEETPVLARAPELDRVPPAPDPSALRAALAQGATDPEGLRDVLGDPQDSPVLDLLRAQLTQPRVVDELVTTLGQLPQRTHVSEDALRAEVAGWLLLGAATHTPAGPPVLEAKVHLFLRGMPKLVRCAGAGEHLLLNGSTTCRDDECAARTTYPLGICLGCGQDYDLERSDPDGQPERYVARRLHADPVQAPDRRASDWYADQRCTGCGRAASGTHCHDCGGALRDVFVAVAEPGKPLTRCPVCGYGRSAGAIEEFTTRTAAAVTATAFSLHSGLAGQSDDELLRRMLIFADSRQDTAFQSGYIRARARAVQVRRFIVEAVRQRQRQGRPPASFHGLVEDVLRLGQAAGLYDDPAGADARQRVLRVCEWDVLGEIANDERRPPTLERLGLLSIGYPALDQLSGAELEPLFVHTGNDEPAVRWFLGRILDHARTRGGVSHELLRSRMDARTESDLIEAGATVRIGAPITGLGDTVIKVNGAQPISMGFRGAPGTLGRKIFPAVTTSDGVERAVRAAVELLVRHHLLDDVQVGTGKAQVRLRQVAPQEIEVRPASSTLHRCSACRAVQPEASPRGRCATFNCRGVVKPWAGDADDHERLLATGEDPLVVKVEEHSGQVALEDRESIEERFKTGDLNLLVCTMTLELGVDLGQLLAVILRNVPPRPSNYAQRAGRAGRREERVALVVTFTGTMPHDSYYYARPVEMIRGAIRPPAFLLDNQRVIARHARSLALELCGRDLPLWMRDLVSEDPAGQVTGVDGVREALAADALAISDRIFTAFRTGIGDTDLAWLDREWCRRVVDAFIADLNQAVEPYRTKQKTLLEEWQQAAARPSHDASKALTSISASLDAMRFADRSRAYVLSYLNSVGFLPSYAFPTDTTTLSLQRETVELSHESVRALRDYAPGQLVYARGAKWFVDEIDLRRANLVNADGAGALPTRNICPRCDTVNDATAASCLSCDNTSLWPQVAVPMRALRAERRQRITADEEARSRRPFDITHHLGAPMTTETWLFERPGLILQWERNAALTVLNRGRVTKSSPPGLPPEQFLICTGCGMWFETPTGSTPTQAQRKRQTLHDRRCNNQDVRPSVLMVERKADCLHLLPDMESFAVGPAELPSFLASIRAALDLGGRIVLQAGDGEVGGFDWPRPDPNSDDALLRLAVMYEEVPGGAGYLRQLAERFGEVADSLLPVLDDCSCERSCYACLRSYHNQTEAELLDRKLAAVFVRAFAGAPDVQGRRIPVFSDGFIGLPRSPIERRLAGSLIAAGAPRGHAQYPWGDRGSTDGTPRPVAIVDFAWPDQRIAVFCDGWEHHHTAEQRADDKVKRDAMIAGGWIVLSFWGGEIVREPDACANKIMRSMGQAR